MNLFLLLIIGLISSINVYLNDSHCASRENFTEDVKSSVWNLCREVKIENLSLHIKMEME
jgi:hypothetical protein